MHRIWFVVVFSSLPAEGLELYNKHANKNLDSVATADWSSRSQRNSKVLTYEDITPPTTCKHHLSGVDDATVFAALQSQPQKNPLAASPRGSTLLHSLQDQKIFVAACLHQSVDVLPHWEWELTRLLLSLKKAGTNNSFFVSIYESGSHDGTAEYLAKLEQKLHFMGIASKIVTGGITRQGAARIKFLADVRNKAMEPILASTEKYDRVLWLSDNLFCADGVLQMLAHALPKTQGGLGADAVCGMDYVHAADDSCVFYDVWASHDIAGNNFDNTEPIVHAGSKEAGNNRPGPGEDQLKAGEPFQVFSCWNAMVVFDADIFQKEKLLFRTNREQLGECAVAETEFIFRDMWSIGRGKIALSPKGASSYVQSDFDKCAIGKQPEVFDTATPVMWKPAPEQVSCCALEPSSDYVDFGTCTKELWNRFGGPPRGSQDPTLLQADSVPAALRLSPSLLQVGLDTHHPRTWHLPGACASLAVVVFSYMYLQGLNKSNEVKNLYVVIFFWMTMSLLMNLLNKQCTLLLHCPFTLVLIQMLVAVVMLARTPISGMKREDLWRWCALSVLFGMMLCSSMFAITHCSVTEYLVLRNCLPILTLPVEKAVLPNSAPASRSMVFSLCVIALGASMYARFAPGYSASSAGLVWVVINGIVTVVHRCLERKILTSDMKLSFEAMTLINNVIPLAPVAMLAWATGETQQWPKYTYLLHEPLSIAVLACAGIVGMCLGQSSIMVQKCVTATSMMVLQSWNKLFIILGAMLLFHERFTPISCLGCALSLSGCVGFGMAQNAAKAKSQEQQPLLPTNAESRDKQ